CWVSSQLFRTFFFSSRRRHTRFSRDWSSDVCSSDLRPSGCPTTSFQAFARPERASIASTRTLSFRGDGIFFLPLNLGHPRVTQLERHLAVARKLPDDTHVFRVNGFRRVPVYHKLAAVLLQDVNEIALVERHVFIACHRVQLVNRMLQR